MKQFHINSKGQVVVDLSDPVFLLDAIANDINVPLYGHNDNPDELERVRFVVYQDGYMCFTSTGDFKKFSHVAMIMGEGSQQEPTLDILLIHSANYKFTAKCIKDLIGNPNLVLEELQEIADILTSRMDKSDTEVLITDNIESYFDDTFNDLIEDLRFQFDED